MRVLSVDGPAVGERRSPRDDEGQDPHPTAFAYRFIPPRRQSMGSCGPGPGEVPVSRPRLRGVDELCHPPETHPPRPRLRHLRRPQERPGHVPPRRPCRPSGMRGPKRPSSGVAEWPATGPSPARDRSAGRTLVSLAPSPQVFTSVTTSGRADLPGTGPIGRCRGHPGKCGCGRGLSTGHPNSGMRSASGPRASRSRAFSGSRPVPMRM